jgi:hypothetical protein
MTTRSTTRCSPPEPGLCGEQPRRGRDDTGVTDLEASSQRMYDLALVPIIGLITDDCRRHPITISLECTHELEVFQNVDAKEICAALTNCCFSDFYLYTEQKMCRTDCSW